MAMRKNILKRRGRKKLNESFGLNLTAMMDILTIILVFLVKSAAVSTNNFQTVEGMKLPTSISPDMPPDSLHLIITPEAMTFDSDRILEFIQTADSVAEDEAHYEFQRGDLDEGGRRILPLFDALMKAKEKAELLRAKSDARDEEGNPLPFDGVLAIQTDKRIKYDTLRKVMYTAGSAGYTVFRLLALQRGS